MNCNVKRRAHKLKWSLRLINMCNKYLLKIYTYAYALNFLQFCNILEFFEKMLIHGGET